MLHVNAAFGDISIVNWTVSNGGPTDRKSCSAWYYMSDICLNGLFLFCIDFFPLVDDCRTGGGPC